MRTMLETVATEAASRLIEKYRGSARVSNPTDEFAEVIYQPGMEYNYDQLIETAMLYVEIDTVRINHVYIGGLVIIQFFRK